MRKTLRPDAPLADVNVGDWISLRVPRAFAPDTDTEVDFDAPDSELREVELTGMVTAIQQINDHNTAGFLIFLTGAPIDGVASVQIIKTSRYNTSVRLVDGGSA